MLKTLAIVMIALTSTAVTASAAQACGGGCCATAPAAACCDAAAPMAMAASAPTTGYRTYSYEPGSYVAPRMRRSYGTPNVFRDAGGKIRGY